MRFTPVIRHGGLVVASHEQEFAVIARHDHQLFLQEPGEEKELRLWGGYAGVSAFGVGGDEFVTVTPDWVNIWTFRNKNYSTDCSNELTPSVRFCFPDTGKIRPTAVALTADHIVIGTEGGSVLFYCKDDQGWMEREIQVCMLSISRIDIIGDEVLVTTDAGTYRIVMIRQSATASA